MWSFLKLGIRLMASDRVRGRLSFQPANNSNSSARLKVQPSGRKL